jgi:AhpD family alkylhydroperoxidase
MSLDNKILALIAVGASVSANCQPCLERNVRTAIKCGADVQQIAEAIEIGKKVRQGVATKMDQFALSLNNAVPALATEVAGGCGCSSSV